VDRTRATWVAGLCILLIAAVAYANALNNGLTLDDGGIIPKHAVILHTEPLWNAFTTPYWPSGAGQYRPLVIASFAVESWLWGQNPLGYHALNLVWHALASLLAYLVARRWLSYAGSLIAGLVFALHPVHVEAVANVVGRAELMAGAGVLAMLLLHERRSKWAIAAFALALFSKEHALVAIALAAGWDLATRAALTPGERERRPSAVHGARALYAGYALVAGAWVAALAVVFHDAPLVYVDPLWLSTTAVERWLTMLGVVPTWVSLWFFPANLSADYSPRVTTPWPDSALLTVVGAIIVVVALVAAFESRKRAVVVTVALAWIFISVAPIANILVPTGIVAAERTLYLSSVGAALLFGYAGERFGQWRPGVATAFALVVCSAFAWRTWTRTPVWESNKVLFTATIEGHPESSRTHVHMARVFSRTGQFGLAVDAYKRAIIIFDRDAISWSEAITAAGQSGSPALADSLIREARLRFNGDYLIDVAHANHALATRRYAEGMRVARAAVEIAPDSAAPRFLVGAAWAGLGQPDSALAWLARVQRSHPLGPKADSLVRALRGPPPDTTVSADTGRF
jgi:tetratricopeptide (TPR) repeat protein